MIQLEGSAAREVVAKSCGHHLYPLGFPVGTCTRTRLAQLAVIVDFVNVKARFELYVGAQLYVLLALLAQRRGCGFLEPAQSEWMIHMTLHERI